MTGEKPTSKSSMKTISEAMREYLPYSQLGFQIVAAVGLGFLAGYWIDSAAGTGVLFTIVCSVLGIAVAIVTMSKTVEQINKRKDS